MKLKYSATAAFLCAATLSGNLFAQTSPAPAAESATAKAAPEKKSAATSEAPAEGAPSEAAEESPASQESTPAEEGAASEEGAAAEGAAVATGATLFDDSQDTPEAPDGSDAEADPEFEADIADLQAENEAKEKKRLAQEKALRDKAAAEAAKPYNQRPFTHHVKHLDLFVGARVSHAGSDGLDAYRDSPAVAQGFGRVGGVVYAADKFAVAALAEVGGGKMSYSLRGRSTQLRMLNTSLDLEARYHFHHRFYAYGRVAGGPEFAWATLGTEYESDALKDSSVGFRGDALLGTAFRFAGYSDGSIRGPRFWVFLEGGYRYGTKHKTTLTIKDGDTPRPEGVEMPAFTLSGAQGGGGVGVTF